MLSGCSTCCGHWRKSAHSYIGSLACSFFYNIFSVQHTAGLLLLVTSGEFQQFNWHINKLMLRLLKKQQQNKTSKQKRPNACQSVIIRQVPPWSLSLLAAAARLSLSLRRCRWGEHTFLIGHLSHGFF